MAVLDDSALGLYFSVPFCRAKCTYCNFASGVYPASEHERYVERLIADLAASAAWADGAGVTLPGAVDTIYFGGGTPVLLAPELFTRIFASIRRNFAVDEDAEITVECAPGQLSDATLAALVAAGVNRVSLGVQSFVDREASLSGRLHTRAMVLEDLRRLRAAGISNLNIDLLAGLAEQTPKSWRESLAVLVASETPHASVYMLEIDEDSRLGRELIAGGARYSAGLVPTDDAIAAMYEEAVATLAGAGLAQYEISNFARPGMESRHNLRYWQRRPYLGLGLDASSMLRAEDGLVLRTTTTEDLREYLDGKRTSGAEAQGSLVGSVPGINPRPTQGLMPAQGLMPTQGLIPIQGLMAGIDSGPTDFGDRPNGGGGQSATFAICETAWLGPGQQLEEAWFLGLRRNQGVAMEAIRAEFGADAAEASLAVAKGLAEDGLVRLDSGGFGTVVRLTDRGRMISNDVFGEFLGLASERVGELAGVFETE